MLIQIHMLQNYAPSNLNRDDTGAPKDAFFGGFRRGRISSQCLKRSIRRSETFATAFSGDGKLGVRTRQLPELVRKELGELGAKEEEIRNIVSRLDEIGRESTKRSAEPASEEETTEVSDEAAATKQLIFIGRDELRPLATKLLALYKQNGAEKWNNPKKLPITEITKEISGTVPRSVDIAMFGRMTTSTVFDDVSAAVQVAHAISTNALSQEFDYYTAVDDLSGQTSAEMIGDVEFNSSTYYKYLNVFWEGLVNNLGGDHAIARRSVLALLEAAATAQPTGKQNTFAAQNLPDLVLVEVSSRNIPVSYANAFLKPARANEGKSLMDSSVEKLADYAARLTKTFDLQPKRAFTATEEYEIPSSERQASLTALGSWLEDHLAG